MGVVLALAASLSWGVSDFTGGLLSRRTSVLTALAVSQPAGLVLVGVVLLAHWQAPPPGRDLLWGALAGLAGIIEVSATVNHLQPNISPGYGFTAIIVAFLGRLHPVGILIAALFLALTFIGGESAQISLKVPLDLTKVFQGILLFYVLACDTLILYRFRLLFAPKVIHGVR